MKQLISDTASWPTGARLALFFYLPAIVVVQVIGVLAEVPLYLEYRLTSLLRAQRRVPAPDIVGAIASAIAWCRPAVRTATWMIVLLAAAVVAISAAAMHTHNNHLLHSADEFVNRWWHSIAMRAGLKR